MYWPQSTYAQNMKLLATLCFWWGALIRRVFCLMLSLPEKQAFAQGFACLGGTRFCWSSFANRDNWSSNAGDCENGTKLSVGSAEAPWTSLFLPCVASPAIPSATFNGVGGRAVNQRSTLGAMLLRFGQKTIWQFQWLLLLQSGVANQKAKVGAPCVHQSALVEARGTQLWVASFHSDQSLRLPRCCSTFSSISGMRVFVVGWWLVWGHSDQQIWSSETNGSRDGTIWRLPPRFCRPKFQGPSKTHKHLSCPAEGAKYLYPAKFEWPSGILQFNSQTFPNFQTSIRETFWDLRTCSCWSTATVSIVPIPRFSFLRTIKTIKTCRLDDTWEVQMAHSAAVVVPWNFWDMGLQQILCLLAAACWRSESHLLVPEKIESLASPRLPTLSSPLPWIHGPQPD